MRTILMLATAAALTFVQAVAAQTWRPPPDSERCPSKWGADDQRGSGNHMGPESVLRAARLIETGQVFELGRVLEESMPLPAGRQFDIFTKRTRYDAGSNRRSSNEELVVSEIGQVGTQFDTFSHQMIGDSLYNCANVADVVTRTGFTKFGVEQVGALMTRGVLIDVAALKRVPVLPNSYEITPQDLQDALAAQRLTLQPGDAVLIHTGWGTHWGKDNARYQASSPGIGVAAAEWLARQDPMLVGADNSASRSRRIPIRSSRDRCTSSCSWSTASTCSRTCGSTSSRPARARVRVHPRAAENSRRNGLDRRAHRNPVTPMQRTLSNTLHCFAVLAMAVVGLPAGAQTVPQLQVDPFWPKALPNNWLLGQVSGVAVDSRDHIWIVQRPASLSERELGAAQSPPLGQCCVAAPPVLVFDQSGNLVRAWGGPGTGYEWPASEHGIFVDETDSVWLAGNGDNDSQLLKFTLDGKFLLQIGRSGQSRGSNDTANLGSPADISVDVAAREVYVADGYRNRRVIVFDSETGAYKRHWGAYGERPSDDATPAYDPAAPPSRQFGNPVHCVRPDARRPRLRLRPRQQSRADLPQGRHVRIRGVLREEHALERLRVGARVLARCRAALHLHGRRRQQRAAHRRAGDEQRARSHRPARPLCRAVSRGSQRRRRLARQRLHDRGEHGPARAEVPPPRSAGLRSGSRVRQPAEAHARLGACVLDGLVLARALEALLGVARLADGRQRLTA